MPFLRTTVDMENENEMKKKELRTSESTTSRETAFQTSIFRLAAYLLQTLFTLQSSALPHCFKQLFGAAEGVLCVQTVEPRTLYVCC